MSKVVANAGCAIAGLCAFFWLILSFGNAVWISSNSNLISFKASLLSIYTSQGTASAIISGGAALVGVNSLSNKISDLLDKSLWMEGATTTYCEKGYDMLFAWCDNWMMTKYSSWGMLFFAVVTAIFLLVGAAFMYYYYNVHATETGRTQVKVCFITAPLTALAGLSQWTMMTMEFGQMKNVGKVTSMYGTGYMCACVLCLLTWVPLCIHAIFFRKAKNEKEHGGNSSDSDYEGGGYGAMGQANMGPGYNSYGPPPGGNMGGPPMGVPPIGGMGGPPLGGPPMGGPGMGGPPPMGFGGPPMGGPGMGGPGMGSPAPVGTFR